MAHFTLMVGIGWLVGVGWWFGFLGWWMLVVDFGWLAEYGRRCLVGCGLVMLWLAGFLLIYLAVGALDRLWVPCCSRWIIACCVCSL